MNKGFTLIELLGVIILILLITVLVLPNTLNSVRNSKDDVDEVTEDLIKKATSLYIQNNQDSYKEINGNIYCITLEKLVIEDYLKSPITYFNSDEDLTFKKSVEASYDNGFSYKIVDNNNCIPKISEQEI